MARSKGDGIKAYLNRIVEEPVPISNDALLKIEGIIGGLSLLSRKQIASANEQYLWVASNSSSDNTVTAKKAIRALEAWIAATKKLRIALKSNTPTRSRTKFEILGELRVLKLEGFTPTLALLHPILELALSSAELSLSEIATDKVGAELKGDLWLAWVLLIARAVEASGKKSTTASRSKTVKDSKFVIFVEHLQQLLPRECRRFQGYNSIAKGVQKAKKKFGHLTDHELSAIINMWGAGILSNYDPALIREVVEHWEERIRTADDDR